MAITISEAATQEQVAEIIEALGEVVVQRHHLEEFADAVETALPALIARHSPTAQVKCSPVSWIFTLARDPSTGLILSILANPMESPR